MFELVIYSTQSEALLCVWSLHQYTPNLNSQFCDYSRVHVMLNDDDVYDVTTDDNDSNYDIENYSDATVGDDDIYELSTDDTDSDYGVDNSSYAIVQDNTTGSYQELTDYDDHNHQDMIYNDSTLNDDCNSSLDSTPGVNSNELSCIAINVCGFKSKEIFPDFIQLIRNHDIICISESKLADTDSVKVDGYTAFYKNRSKFKRKSGGILVLINNRLLKYLEVIEEESLKHKIEEDSINYYSFVNYELCKNAIFFTINSHTSGDKILFGAVYIEPDNSPYFNRQAYTELETSLIQIGTQKVCLLGDFNSRTSDMNEVVMNNIHVDSFTGIDDDRDSTLPKRVSKDKFTNTMGYELITFCKTCQLIIANGRIGKDAEIGEFTCKNASVVDYVLLSNTLIDQVANFEILCFNELFSDIHCAVLAKFSFLDSTCSTEMDMGDVDINRASNNESEGTNKTVKWDNDKKGEYFNSLNMETINRIESELDNLITNTENVTNEKLNNVVTEINSLFVTTASQLNMIKKKKTHKHRRNNHNKPWFNKICKTKRKEFIKARRRHLKNPGNENLAKERKRAANEYRKTVRASERNCRQNFSQTIRSMKSTNPKAYWDIINKNNSNINLQMPDCNDFLEMFKNMGTDNLEGDNHNILSDTVTEPTLDDPFLNELFTDKDIVKGINSLKNNKAFGLDMIINEFLKTTCDKITKMLTKLFNLVLITGHIPDDWTIGIIKPIYKKKGDLLDTNNYRGITILSCLGKLFTCLLNNRLNDFLETNDILGNEQAGFRKQFSTTDHLFTLYGIIDILTSKKKRLYCAFLDYEKAFDKVDRAFLWHKLLNQNISGRILNVIRNIYSSAKSCVMVNGVCSNFFNTHIGVRQGENLSPILFSLFLNDMKAYLENETFYLNTLGQESVNCEIENHDVLLKLFLLLYADDTVIFSESPDGLQRLLTEVQGYCNKWKLKLNSKKCKIVIFSRGKVRKYPIFYIGDEAVEVVSSFVYLGLKLNYNNRMLVAQKDLYDRASRAMFALLKKGNLLKLPPDIMIDLFDKTVLPILTYGCEVWGFENDKIIQSLQLKFYKIVLKLKQSTPTLMVFGETAKFPVSISIKCRILSFWYKLISPQNKDKISSLVYSLLHRMYQNGLHKSKFLDFIKSILIDIGLPSLWSNQSHLNFNLCWLKAFTKQHLQDLFLQDWYSHLSNDSIFTTYKLIKKEFKIDPYFTLLPHNCVLELVRFRTTNNPLPVNALRYSSIPRKERVCEKCGSNEVADELHYLFYCDYFNNERNQLLPKYPMTIRDSMKFEQLFNSNNKKQLLKLKHFICILSKELQNNN